MSGSNSATDPRLASVPVEPDAIPPELRAGKRFVAWRYEDHGQAKPAKVPYSPKTLKRASSTDPSDWATFDDALRYARVAHLDGVMRAFDPADGLVGTDFDNCRDPETGELSERVAAYVRRLDTYTEVSPSGTGVKLWACGSLPAHGRKHGDVELYDRARFFTVTGRHVEGTPATVGYRPDAILAIHREVFGDAPEPTTVAGEHDGPVPALELGDEDVLRLASTSQHNGERFRRLWSGNTGDYAADGNGGASEADAALCELLAYYGGPDRDRIDRLFRRSGLYRPKWDERRGAQTYGERTIDLALKGKTRFYGDGMQPPKAVGSDGATGCACEDCPAVAEVARLRRLALDRDDLVEYQQSIIRTQRTKLDDMTGYLSHVTEILARPNDELPPSQKVWSLAMLPELHFRAAYGPYTLPDGTSGSYRTDSGRIRTTREVMARRTGYSPSQASKIGREIAERENAPFTWHTTRDWRTRADGSQGWVTTIELEPKAEQTAESMRALVASVPVDRARHGGSKNAAEATAERWRRRCEEHQEAGVVFQLRTLCDAGGEVLGERLLTAEECAALEVQDGLPEGGPQAVSVSVPIAVQDALPDLAVDELSVRRARDAVATPGRAPDPWKQPGYQKPPPTSCRLCPSVELYQLADGRWRCDGCGEIAS